MDDRFSELFEKFYNSCRCPYEKKTLRVLSEFFQTEKMYIQNLYALIGIKSYLKAINSTASHKKINLIFQNLISAKSLHEKIYQKIATEIDSISSTYNFNEISNFILFFCEQYLKFLPFLKMYTFYFEKLTDSLCTLQQLIEENDQFNTLISQIEKKCNKPIIFLLNSPLQRLTKYPMFFNNLLKYFSKTKMILNEFDDCEKNKSNAMIKLTELAKSAENIILSINNSVGSALEMNKLFQFYNKVSSQLSQKCSFMHKLKCQIEVNKLVVQKGRVVTNFNNCQLTLINDFLVLTQKVEVQKNRSVQKKISRGGINNFSSNLRLSLGSTGLRDSIKRISFKRISTSSINNYCNHGIKVLYEVPISKPIETQIIKQEDCKKEYIIQIDINKTTFKFYFNNRVNAQRLVKELTK